MRAWQDFPPVPLCIAARRIAGLLECDGENGEGLHVWPFVVSDDIVDRRLVRRLSP